MHSMKASYKGYTIITTAAKVSVSDRDMWELTLRINDADQQRLVGAITFPDLLPSVDAVHEAGVLIARRWIDGDSGSMPAAA